MTKEKDSKTQVEEIAAQIFAGPEISNFLGLSAEQLENIAFYDFSEYCYIMPPEPLGYTFVPPEQLDPTTPGAEPVVPIPEPGVGEEETRIFKSVMIPRIRHWAFKAKGGAPWWYFANFAGTELFWNIIIKAISTRIWNILIGVGLEQYYADLLDCFNKTREIDVPTNKFLDIVLKQFFYEDVGGLPYVFVFSLAIDTIRIANAQAGTPPVLLISNDALKNRWMSVIDYIYANHKPGWDAAWEEKYREIPEPELIPISHILPKAKIEYKREKEYPFLLFEPNSWNIGLRLVYRQEWRSLGNQRGEVLKTVPLGPKQVEKVSTKIVRRTKVTKTAENLTSTEQTVEVSDTTKDSSEIVNEASESQKWHVEGEASMSYGGFSGKISAGMEGEAERRTNGTTSHLSESMQKTASKIRKESKTIVSTESESTYEVTTSSEITNPNEEIPITFVYSKLQRQYEVFTSLAEVKNVVMIAEDIPEPHEINYEWVKRYDWILARVLLDDSFRDVLTSISQAPIFEDQGGIVDKLQEKLLEIEKFFKEFTGTSLQTLSLGSTDIIQEAQKNYQELIKNYKETYKQELIMEYKRERLYQHIQDNILYYCRAIWQREDPQQRILRYAKQGVRIPTNWWFISYSDPDETEQELEDLLTSIKEAETDEDPGFFELEGYFVYSEDPNDFIDIIEIINPAGPIGFYGNYSIYYIKPEHASEDIFKLLDILKKPYLYYETINAEPILMDPLLKRETLKVEEQRQSTDGIELTKAIKEEMIEYIPEIRVAFNEKLREGEEESFFDEDNDDLFMDYYAEYLFRKERSRKLLLDTHNVILDIEPGTGSALEKFKLAHRGVDVLKALEEKKALELDNERRKKLLDKGKLHSKYWPGVEKIVLFDDGKDNCAEEAGEGDSGPPFSGPIDHPIKDIKKLRRLIAKLEELGIDGTLKLLRKADTVAERRGIIQLLEVTEQELKEIIAVIDLMRIRGLSEEDAELLDAIGVNSVKELARRNAKNLYELLEEHGKQHRKKVPDESKIQEWIEQAKRLN